MKKSRWILEKDLFGLYLANQGVQKLINDQGQVMLVALDMVSGKKLSQLQFASIRDYEEWMDAVVSDYDGFHNPARALHCVLRAMIEEVGDYH